jgi:hypothetical protein
MARMGSGTVDFLHLDGTMDENDYDLQGRIHHPGAY